MANVSDQSINFLSGSLGRLELLKNIELNLGYILKYLISDKNFCVLLHFGYYNQSRVLVKKKKSENSFGINLPRQID